MGRMVRTYAAVPNKKEANDSKPKTRQHATMKSKNYTGKHKKRLTKMHIPVQAYIKTFLC